MKSNLNCRVIVVRRHKPIAESCHILKMPQGEISMLRCPYGHPYDEKQFSSCPWCNAGGGETRKVDTSFHVLGSTNNLSEDSTKTKPLIPENTVETEAKTKIFAAGGKTSGQPDPVAGWLVCCEGSEKGRDYRVHFGQNTVGRDRDMDIVLQDKSVSRNSHLFITYDYKHNNFVVQQGISHGLVYKNDNLVTGAEELVSFDVLEIGDSKYIFIAFCGEKFQWKQDEKQ